MNRGRAVDRTVRHRVALEGHPPNLFVCVKTILEYYSTFFPVKVLDAAIFSIYLNLAPVRVYLDLDVLGAP